MHNKRVIGGRRNKGGRKRGSQEKRGRCNTHKTLQEVETVIGREEWKEESVKR